MIIPAPLGKEYLPYQIRGIKFCLGARGTLIADEMGLGKTVQAIGVINASPTAERVLIVAPAGLCLNWRNELDEWLLPIPGQCVQVITYHQVEHILNDPGEFDILIVDEAHYVKNPVSQRSKNILALTKRAKRILMLTGTPIESKPIELWPILQMVCPEKWDNPNLGLGVLTLEQKKTHPGQGVAFWRFAKDYCELKKTSFGRRGRSAWDFSGASNLDKLQARLRKTCMVRRLKKDVLEQLPNKIQQVIVLPSKGINDDHILPHLNEGNYHEVIAKLTADKVAFAEFSKRRHEQALAMTDDVIRFVEDALDASQKIILFAHHANVIEKLRYAFVETGVDTVVVTGATHVADRGAAVHRFQTDPNCRLFIGSILAAGVGITLTAASHVIFAEIDPVPGKMTQAADRAHRIGQRWAVLVQYLVWNRSISARMAKIIVRKQNVITAALDKVTP